MGTKYLYRIILVLIPIVLLFPAKESLSYNLIDWPEYDPVGQQIFNPIEKNVPKLDLSGFIQNETKIPFHKTLHTDFENPRRDKLDFLKIEWLMQLKGDYRLSDTTRFVGITHFLYDSAFDWDSDFRDSFGDSRKKAQMGKYTQGKRILRELYMDTGGSDWDLRLGRQQVVWGKVDGAKIMDIINPEDFREGPDGSDREITRIPLWMLNYTKKFGLNSLQFLWIWELEPNIIAPTPSPWEANTPFTPEKIYAFFPPTYPGRYFPFKLQTESTRVPEQTLENSEVALRYGFMAGGYDIHLAYFYTWDDFPTYFKRKTLMPILIFPPPPVGGTWKVSRPFTVVLEPTQTRIHQFGFNLDKTLYSASAGKSYTLKGEAVLNVNKYISDVSDDKDGQTKKSTMVSGVSIETPFFVDWFTTLRFDNNVIFNWDDDLRTLAIGRKIKRWERSITLSLFKQFYQDRTSLNSWFAYGLNGSLYNSWWWKTILTHKFNSNWSIKTSMSLFGGKSDQFFGQYDRLDNFEIGINYNF